MSGTDELFPDATPHPGVVVPETAQAVVASGGPVVASRPRGLGVVALVLGLLALLGDLIGIIIAFATLAGALTNVGAELSNVDDSLGALLGVIVVEFIVFFGGILFALLAVILGLVAAIRNRGRVLGILGVVFGAIVLIGHVSLLIGVVTSGNVPGVTS